MKLLHLSDLHLGKRLCDVSLLEDQAYILNQIAAIAAREAVDAVLIAGDVYDKGVPPAEAVALLDQFLTVLAGQGCSVCLIAGNHDSAERLSFGAKLMDGRGVYFAPVYDGAVRCVTLQDGFGPVHLWLLPFLKPAVVRRVWPEESVETYSDALQCVLSHVPLDPSARNVLLSHQFVTGAVRCESEEISVGGLDNVDAAVYEAFDYVALGHIHTAQNVGVNARYCGTPLGYSFSEAGQEKSVTIVTLGEKGCVERTAIPLTPLHGLREVRGNYLDLARRETYEGTAVEDYLLATLTDEEDVPDAMAKLRTIYPNLLRLRYDNRRTRECQTVELGEEGSSRSPLELFGALYEQQNTAPLSDEQSAFLQELMTRVWEEEA